jgi:predicted nucleotidyltransferase
MKSFESAPIRRNEREAIDAAVMLLRERFPVEKAILCGSKVRGDSDEYSDIDLQVHRVRIYLNWQCVFHYLTDVPGLILSK